MWELEKHPTASAWNYIPGGSDVGTALGRRQEHPPAQPSSRELPGTLLPQQIPRPHKSLTQLLVLRPEVKACRSARGVGTAEADPCAGAVLLSKLLFNFLTVWFGVAQEGKTPWPAPFPRRSCHLQSTQKVPAIAHCLQSSQPKAGRAPSALAQPDRDGAFWSSWTPCQSDHLHVCLHLGFATISKRKRKIIKGIDGTYGNTAQPGRHQELMVDGGTQP